jgi:hypothetical protein
MRFVTNLIYKALKVNKFCTDRAHIRIAPPEVEKPNKNLLGRCSAWRSPGQTADLRPQNHLATFVNTTQIRISSDLSCGQRTPLFAESQMPWSGQTSICLIWPT